MHIPQSSEQHDYTMFLINRGYGDSVVVVFLTQSLCTVVQRTEIMKAMDSFIKQTRSMGSRFVSLWFAPLPVFALLLGVSMSVGWHVTAQVPSGIDMDALEMLQAEQALNDRVFRAEQDLARARLSKTDCANQEAMQKAQVAAQKAEQKAGALGEIATSTVGALAQSAILTAGSEKKKAERGLAIARGEGDGLVNEFRAHIGWNKGKTELVIKDQPGLIQKCPGTTTAKDSGGTHTTTTGPCSYSEIRKEVAEINKTIRAALTDIAGASDIAWQAPAVGAAVGVLGAGMKMHAANQGLKGQEKATQITRQMCESQANLAIQDAQRKTENERTYRDQELMNLRLRQAARKALAGSSDVEVAGLGGGPAGPGVALPMGGNLAAAAADSPNSGGGAGGGGAGAGGGAPGAGGGSASSMPWSFGNDGDGDSSAFQGLPSQPSIGQSAIEGGGGGGGGGGFGFDDGFDEAALGGVDGFGAQMADEEYYESEDFLLGDGGLVTMMSRARRRYGAHANELVRSLDLKEFAKKSPSVIPSIDRPPAAIDLKNQL